MNHQEQNEEVVSVDDLAALSDKVVAQWKTAGDRLDKAMKALQGFPDGGSRPELDRLLREEAKASGAWRAWSEMHQMVLKQRLERANRRGDEQ